MGLVVFNASDHPDQWTLNGRKVDEPSSSRCLRRIGANRVFVTGVKKESSDGANGRLSYSYRPASTGLVAWGRRFAVAANGGSDGRSGRASVEPCAAGW